MLEIMYECFLAFMTKVAEDEERGTYFPVKMSRHRTCYRIDDDFETNILIS